MPVNASYRTGTGRAMRSSRTRTVTVNAVIAARPDSKSDDIRQTIKKTALITAVKTPYLENGKIDMSAYDNLIQIQIANGCEGVIVGGTTGEGQLMSWDEHIMLIAHTVNCFGDKLIVVGNTGSNSTREAIHATEQGFAVGMHAALSINPYYGKTSKRGVMEHFNACLNEGPAIIYNVPGRTGQDITPDLVETLAQHENFLGMKECMGNARIQGYTRQGITCWSGNDDEAHAARHECGAAGVISVTSNVIPGVFAQLMRERDDQKAESLQPLIKWLFHEPNPIPVNTALAMLGLAKPVFRMPYVPTSKEQRAEGAKLMAPLLGSIPGNKGVKVMEDSEFILVKRYC